MEQHRSVGTSERLVSQTFGMEISSKAFQIVIGKLYSDRIKAVIREISTNAYDSHIVNGNADEPFDVHLPTLLEPVFSVRDYGTGLSHEEIHSVYAVCFRSSKTENEDATGCLGLGSKSPLSYVDSFTVESFKDGMHYIYAIHYNEDNIPVMTPMGHEPTTERNGLKVSIAVESDDIQTFINKAAVVYKYFKVKPNTSGGILDFEQRVPTLKGDGWEVYGSGNAVAIMNSVAYPIRADDSYFSAEQNSLIRQYGLELHFDSGAISFEPSRENLSYDKLTIQRIKTKVDKALEEIIKTTQDELNKCSNLYEARLKYLEFVEQNSSIANFSKLLKYRNLKLEIKIGDEYLCDLPIYTALFNRVRMKEHKLSYHLTIRKNDVYIYIDDDKFCQKKIKAMFWNNTGKCYYICRFTSDEQRHTFAALLGTDDSIFVKASEIPMPPKQSSTYTRNKVGQVNLYKTRHLTTDCWTPEEVDFENDSGIYVDIAVGKVIMPDGTTVHANVIDGVCDSLNSLGYKVDEVYGVKKKSKELVVNNPNWQSLWDFCKEVVNEYIVKNKMEEVMSYINGRTDYNMNWIETAASYIKFDDNHLFAIFKKEKAKKDEYHNKYYGPLDSIKSLERTAQFTTNIVALPPVKFSDWANELAVKYPLTKALYNSQQRVDHKHMAFYINQVDKENFQ